MTIRQSRIEAIAAEMVVAGLRATFNTPATLIEAHYRGRVNTNQQLLDAMMISAQDFADTIADLNAAKIIAKRALEELALAA